MRRGQVLVLVALGLIVFLAISAVLARVLTVDGAERSAITLLLQDQARGDAAAMVGRIRGCAQEPACRRRAVLNATALRRPGKLVILELNPSAGFSLGSTLGTARVAWRAGGSLPIVQCVRVRRAGNALSGLRVQLLEISRRIKSDTSCPARY
jgi:hypothetical protein